MAIENDNNSPSSTTEDPYNTDLRAAVSAAYAEHAGAPEDGDGGTPPPPSGSPGGELGDPPTRRHDTAGGTELPKPTDPVRGDDGRFTKSDKKKQPEVVAGSHGAAAPKGGAAPPVAAPPTTGGEPVASTDKAPQSWKPAAREAWAALPPDIRAEVSRREKENAQVLEQSAQARNLLGELGKVVAPYEAMIRSEGSTPLQAINNLLQTAGALRTAPPGRKAELVAGLIKQYGVDIGMLDSILSGEGVPQGGAPQQQQLDPAAIIRQAKEELRQELTGQRTEFIQKQADSEVERFAAGKEFFEDLREDMALVSEAAARKGLDMDLEAVYNRAVAMNPEVQQVLRQREEAAKRAANPNGSTQRAKLASSSIRSAPTGPVETDPESRSLRDDIIAAMNQ